MALHQYNPATRRRIANAVRRVEAGHHQRERNRKRWRQSFMDKLVRAQADIEHGDIGDVKHLSGPAIDQSLSLLSNDTAFKVYNPGPKVWAGADMFIRQFAMPGVDESNQSKWYVVQAWSATRIRGIAAGTISPGGTGTINTITTEDGTYEPTTASVYLPTVHVTVETGVVVWASLVYRTLSSSSRWEIYSADCTEA